MHVCVTCKSRARSCVVIPNPVRELSIFNISNSLINKRKSFSAKTQGYHETLSPWTYLAATSVEGFLTLSER